MKNLAIVPNFNTILMMISDSGLLFGPPCTSRYYYTRLFNLWL